MAPKDPSPLSIFEGHTLSCYEKRESKRASKKPSRQIEVHIRVNGAIRTLKKQQTLIKQDGVEGVDLNSLVRFAL